LDRRLGGHQSRFVQGGEERKNPVLCQESNPDRPARSLVIVLIEENGSYIYRVSGHEKMYNNSQIHGLENNKHADAV
jgi:hypothetical protein